MSAKISRMALKAWPNLPKPTPNDPARSRIRYDRVNVKPAPTVQCSPTGSPNLIPARSGHRLAGCAGNELFERHLEPPGSLRVGLGRLMGTNANEFPLIYVPRMKRLRWKTQRLTSSFVMKTGWLSRRARSIFGSRSQTSGSSPGALPRTTREDYGGPYGEGLAGGLLQQMSKPTRLGAGLNDGVPFGFERPDADALAVVGDPRVPFNRFAEGLGLDRVHPLRTDHEMVEVEALALQIVKDAETVVAEVSRYSATARSPSRPCRRWRSFFFARRSLGAPQMAAPSQVRAPTRTRTLGGVRRK